MSDSKFFKVFAGTIGGLVALAVIIFVIANMIGGAVNMADAKATDDKAVAERIKPFGSLAVAAGPIIDTLIPVAKADAAMGKTTYDARCSACHAAGVLGAPKLGDKAGWKDRLAQGTAVLVEHVIKGYKKMPPQGGKPPALSDDEIKDAVAYMVGKVK